MTKTQLINYSFLSNHMWTSPINSIVFKKTSKYSLHGFDHIDVGTPLMMVSNEPIRAHTPSPLTLV